LAKALLEIAPAGKTEISLEELAIPYAQQITEHLKLVDKQTTSRSSQFLETCRGFNAGRIGEDELIGATVRLGFANVLDAFHNLRSGEVPAPFFDKSSWKSEKRIILTDELLRLVESEGFANFEREAEARWRLVETAWSLDISRTAIAIEHDPLDGMLFTRGDRRVNITSCRGALDGYQKGKCFYCFAPISIVGGSENLTDVDHFFPYSLREYIKLVDGVWNLVLSCQKCNRGEGGKFDRLPHSLYLERLHTRNEYFIDSHHPLRETLIAQTGVTERDRRQFLQTTYNEVRTLLGVGRDQGWRSLIEYPQAF
jgi:5-methylcytosine-specific restriction endonuclease McrA